ncbi:hydrolase [Pseudomonas sp.]|uniref:hydrolase n=1 Tax=Pseudomonas sp. TaxID=306 RepID=UPI0028AB9F03|nr:hydrolase [Pseudomonas sp.]
MRQVLLINQVQSTFEPPEWLVDGVRALSAQILTFGALTLHDEAHTPFQQQAGWHPAASDHCMHEADRVFIKHGYGLGREALDCLRELHPERVLVCGVGADSGLLAVGFSLFDAGLTPTLVTDLTIGSWLDRSGHTGMALWAEHLQRVTTRAEVLASLQVAG